MGHLDDFVTWRQQRQLQAGDTDDSIQGPTMNHSVSCVMKATYAGGSQRHAVPVPLCCFVAAAAAGGRCEAGSMLIVLLSSWCELECMHACRICLDALATQAATATTRRQCCLGGHSAFRGNCPPKPLCRWVVAVAAAGSVGKSHNRRSRATMTETYRRMTSCMPGTTR